MIFHDGFGNGLKEHRLPGPRRSDDQASLALSDRSDQLHNPSGEILRVPFQPDALHRIKGSQVVEENFVARDVRLFVVDQFDFQEREVAFPFFGRADLACNNVPSAEIKATDLRRRDVDIVGSRKIVVIGRTEKAEAVRKGLQDPLAIDGAVFLRLGLKYRENKLLLS